MAAGPKIIDIRFESAEQLEKTYHESITKGGFFVPAEDPAPRTTPVELHFHLPGVSRPLVVAGEVAFAATPESPMPGIGPGMAIQFCELSPQISEAFQAAIMIAKLEGMAEGEEPAAEETCPEREGTAAEVLPSANGEETREENGKDEEIDEATARELLARLNQLSSENLYFTVRRLPRHHKIAAAKRGNRPVRNLLLQEGNKQILTFLLQNPQITAAEIIVLLKMSNLPIEIIQLVSKNATWIQNEDIRYFLVVNPKTPLPLALNLMAGLNTSNLARLAKSNLKTQIKSGALRLLEQRRKSS